MKEIIAEELEGTNQKIYCKKSGITMDVVKLETRELINVKKEIVRAVVTAIAAMPTNNFLVNAARKKATIAENPLKRILTIALIKKSF